MLRPRLVVFYLHAGSEGESQFLDPVDGLNALVRKPSPVAAITDDDDGWLGPRGKGKTADPDRTQERFAPVNRVRTLQVLPPQSRGGGAVVGCSRIVRRGVAGR